jgi:hypothetical protein
VFHFNGLNWEGQPKGIRRPSTPSQAFAVLVITNLVAALGSKNRFSFEIKEPNFSELTKPDSLVTFTFFKFDGLLGLCIYIGFTLDFVLTFSFGVLIYLHVLLLLIGRKIFRSNGVFFPLHCILDLLTHFTLCYMCIVLIQCYRICA